VEWPRTLRVASRLACHRLRDNRRWHAKSAGSPAASPELPRGHLATASSLRRRSSCRDFAAGALAGQLLPLFLPQSPKPNYEAPSIAAVKLEEIGRPQRGIHRCRIVVAGNVIEPGSERQPFPEQGQPVFQMKIQLEEGWEALGVHTSYNGSVAVLRKRRAFVKVQQVRHRPPFQGRGQVPQLNNRSGTSQPIRQKLFRTIRVRSALTSSTALDSVRDRV
jgi:hypothetical protein